MKVRLDFITNSSSSSFVIIGKKYKLEDVSLEEFKSKDFMIKTDYSYEGKINIYTSNFKELEELYNFLKNNPPGINNHELIEVIKSGWNSGEIILNLDLIKKYDEILVIYGTEAQHNPTDMYEIKELIENGEY